MNSVSTLSLAIASSSAPMAAGTTISATDPPQPFAAILAPFDVAATMAVRQSAAATGKALPVVSIPAETHRATPLFAPATQTLPAPGSSPRQGKTDVGVDIAAGSRLTVPIDPSAARTFAPLLRPLPETGIHKREDNADDANRQSKDETSDRENTKNIVPIAPHPILPAVLPIADSANLAEVGPTSTQVIGSGALPPVSTPGDVVSVRRPTQASEFGKGAAPTPMDRSIAPLRASFALDPTYAFQTVDVRSSDAYRPADPAILSSIRQPSIADQPFGHANGAVQMSGVSLPNSLVPATGPAATSPIAAILPETNRRRTSHQAAPQPSRFAVDSIPTTPTTPDRSKPGAPASVRVTPGAIAASLNSMPISTGSTAQTAQPIAPDQPLSAVPTDVSLPTVAAPAKQTAAIAAPTRPSDLPKADPIVHAIPNELPRVATPRALIGGEATAANPVPITVFADAMPSQIGAARTHIASAPVAIDSVPRSAEPKAEPPSVVRPAETASIPSAAIFAAAPSAMITVADRSPASAPAPSLAAVGPVAPGSQPASRTMGAPASIAAPDRTISAAAPALVPGATAEAGPDAAPPDVVPVAVGRSAEAAATVRPPAIATTPAVPTVAIAAQAPRLTAPVSPAPKRARADTVIAPDVAPASIAQPQAAPAVAQNAPLDMGRHGWPQAMIDRIEALRDNADAVDTSIRIIPDKLGTIEVSVRRDGEVTHVHFAAEQAQTRTILADAQPRLAELADSRGLKLGQSSIDAGTGQQSQHQRTPQTAFVPAAPVRAQRDEATTDQRIA